jgi:serine/threonine-protein kinase
VFAVVGVLVLAMVAGIGYLAIHLFSSGSSNVSATHGSSVSPSSGATTPRNSATPGATASTSAAPTGPAQLQTADGLGGLLTTIRDKFGDTMGYRLVVYPDYAIHNRASPTNEHVVQEYMYRGGNWKSWGPDSSRSSFDLLVDLSQFNVAAVSAHLTGPPPPELNFPANSQNYLIIEGAEGGGLQLGIYSLSPGTGYMQINPDGSIKKLYPPS